MSAPGSNRAPVKITGIGGAALLLALVSTLVLALALALALGLALVLALGGCSADRAAGPAAVPRLEPGNRCRPAADLVPTCGVWWGYSAVAAGPAALRSVEEELGRPFDLVYRFHDLDDVPDADEQALVARGTLLHVSIVPTDFGDPDARRVPWAAVAAGRYDDELVGQARGIAALGVPVFVTFDHEPDQPAKRASGSAADFGDAWRPGGTPTSRRPSRPTPRCAP